VVRHSISVAPYGASIWSHWLDGSTSSAWATVAIALVVRARIIYRSVEAEQLSLKGSSFGFDLIVQIGRWRFWEHRTLDEI
jgi:hypothetical protein